MIMTGARRLWGIRVRAPVAPPVRATSGIAESSAAMSPSHMTLPKVHGESPASRPSCQSTGVAMPARITATGPQAVVSSISRRRGRNSSVAAVR